jgi:hypothetical protein
MRKEGRAGRREGGRERGREGGREGRRNLLGAVGVGGEEADEAVLGHVEIAADVQGLQVLAQLGKMSEGGREGGREGGTCVSQVRDGKCEGR